MTQRLLLLVLCLFVPAVGHGAEPSLVINSGGNTRQIEDVVFTKDGQYLVSVGNDRVIRIWDVKTGETARAIRDQVSVCADCKISAMALTPDNKYLALGGKFPGFTSDERYAIHLYDFQTGERLELLKGHKSRVISLTFSGDGNKLASGSAFPKNSSEDEDPIHLWTLESQGWRASRSFGRSHKEAVESLAFSPDGNNLLSGGGGPDKNLFLWKLSGSAPPAECSLPGHRDAVLGAAFSPDGESIVSAGLDRQIILWDAQGNFVRVVRQMESNVIELALSPIKEHWHISVGLENGTATVLSLPDGKIVKSLSGRLESGVMTVGSSRDRIGALAFSPDEGLVAGSGGFDGQIWLWNTSNSESAKGRELVGKGRAVWRLGFSIDGNSFAFGTERTKDEPNQYGPLRQVMWLKSPDQPSEYRIALGPRLQSDSGYYSAIKSVGEYELRTRFGETVPRKIGNPDPIRLDELLLVNKKNGKQLDFNRRLSTSGRSHLSYTFTHNGQYVISGGENGYLALYETRNLRQPVIEFEGHTDSVWAVAVSPNGRFLLSGSSDQTIKLWDIKSKDWLLSIFVTVDNEWIAWTPQGYYTSSLGGDRYIGWQVKEEDKKRPEFYRAEQFQKVFYRPDLVAKYLTTFGDPYESLEPTTTVGSRTCGTGGKLPIFARMTGLIASLPPKIEIISPSKDLTEVDRRLLNVKVIVTSVNLPITNVQVLLNGFQRGSFVGSPDGAKQSCKVELDMMVALEPNKNTLEVSAWHSAAKSSSQVRTITFKAPAKTIEVPRPSANSPFDLGGTDMARGPQWRDESPEFLVTSFDGSRETFMTPPTVDGGDNPPTPIAVPEPPTIEILEPSESDTPIAVTEQYFIMTVRIPAGTPGRNFKVRILDNKGEPQTQTIQPGEGTEITRLLVEEGQYVINVIAIVDGVESTPQVRRVIYTNSRPPRGNLYFLGIGVKGYTRLQPGLQWADKDANDLASFLSGLEDSALFESVDPLVLPNSDATRDRIIEEIDNLNKKATNENDLRVVLFSGHGGTFGEELKRFYFYVQDYDKSENPSKKNPEWRNIVDSLLERGNGFGRGPVLVLVDTCRSGNAIPKEFIDSVKLNTLALFAASSVQENAYEDSSWQNGVFTRAVLEGLSGCADASTPGRPSDGVITATELGSWLVQRVNELNAAQNATPYYPIGGKLFIPVRTNWTITVPSIGPLPIKCTGVPQ